MNTRRTHGDIEWVCIIISNISNKSQDRLNDIHSKTYERAQEESKTNLWRPEVDVENNDGH